jgi:hypothetical protein
MSPAAYDQVERSRPATPAAEHVGPGLSTRRRSQAANPGRSVMDTLLGQNSLAAYDSSGGDPYNATGKFFRR